MSTSPAQASAPVSLPRVTITYCTQCRWMLRAAYFGQELLSTFGTQIGEIALVPATGGLFCVELTYIPQREQEDADMRAPVGGDVSVEVRKVLLWDRKAEGGFPETKVLKQRVRDLIDPKRDLGHSDRGGKKSGKEKETEKEGEQGTAHTLGHRTVVDGNGNGDIDRTANSQTNMASAPENREEKVHEVGGKKGRDRRENKQDGTTVCEDCQ